ncbi:hypothetical protein [Paenibacillus agilis]|uniref:DUF1574 domain-containing protein n=1 Tax=Paenibacillus agilis TaxID=3020863 RepID=A0A559J1X4_9BACL|nr:hypothetical protein [Paenibacillus agilis]TVX93851.1 hypothetical protein FPZ44_12785 [Paenibacillus agilis]
MGNFFPWKSLSVLMVSIATLGVVGINQWAMPIVDDMQKEVVSHAKKELRVPAYDSIVYMPLWIEHLKEQPDNGRKKVGVFGPSTVFGTTVKDGKNTTAGVLQLHMKDKTVYNLGLTGGRFTETYAILASMIDEIDYVVYEVNYGIAVVTENEPDVMVYPTMVSKLGQSIPKDWLDEFPTKNKSSLPSDAHNWMTANVLNNWTLFHDRDALSYKFLKTRTPMEKMRRELKKQQDAKKGVKPEPAVSPYRAYDSFSSTYKAKVDKHFKSLYTWKKPFDPNNSFGLFMMEKTLDLLKEHNKKAVFYSAPLDKTLITKSKLLDWKDYNKVMGSYKKLIESRGYPYIEFNGGKNVVDHKYYHDPSHMTDAGNKLFGEILYKRLKQYGITNK